MSNHSVNWNESKWKIIPFEENAINPSEFIDSVLLGPQKSVLEKIKIFNDNYYYTAQIPNGINPLGITNKFRLKSKSSDTIKAIIHYHCLGWKKGTNITNLFRQPYGHYFRNIGGQYNEIARELSNLRYENATFQDNTEITRRIIKEIQNNIQDRISKANEKENVEVFCFYETNDSLTNMNYRNEYTNDTFLTIYMKFSNQKMDIWQSENFIETIDIPGNIWIKTKFNLRKYITLLLDTAHNFDKHTMNETYLHSEEHLKEELSFDKYTYDRLLSYNKCIMYKKEVVKQLNIETKNGKTTKSILEYDDCLKYLFEFNKIYKLTTNNSRYRISSRCINMLGLYDDKYSHMFNNYSRTFPFISRTNSYSSSQDHKFAIKDKVFMNDELTKKLSCISDLNTNRMQSGFGHLCGGSVQSSMVNSLSDMDFESFFVHFENWKTFNIGHTGPLNSLENMFFGIPEKRTDKFKELITQDLKYNAQSVWHSCVFDMNLDNFLNIQSDEHIIIDCPVINSVNEYDDDDNLINKEYEIRQLSLKESLESGGNPDIYEFDDYVNQDIKIKDSNGQIRYEPYEPYFMEICKRFLAKYDNMDSDFRNSCPLFENIEQVFGYMNSNKFKERQLSIESKDDEKEKETSRSREQMEMEEIQRIVRSL